jgi:hypothetical protein
MTQNVKLTKATIARTIGGKGYLSGICAVNFNWNNNDGQIYNKLPHSAVVKALD